MNEDLSPKEQAVIAALIHGFPGESIFAPADVWDKLREGFPKDLAREVVFSTDEHFIPDDEFDKE